MPSFVAFSDQVEVTDKAVSAIVDGVPERYKEIMHGILVQHGIDLKNRQEWYQQQHWLDAFREIAENIGPSTLFGIGKAIPGNAILPFQPVPPYALREALESIDRAYQFNHRGGEIGYYRLTAFAPGRAVMECRNPYPSDFDRGIITAMARTFMPLGSRHLEVQLDATHPTRLAGADACTYLITWQ
ncbi:MAG: hypothetical protein ICV83_00145 [Cytophagales bacterium]|nr:hypothetical protein [Cytophagales bacterium]